MVNIRSFFESDESTTLHTVIGASAAIEGVLRFSGVVHIEGSVFGEIETTGTLFIGRHAVVNARLRVGRLVVIGKFIGEATASDCVELRKTAVFEGNVRAPRMVIEPGALFHAEFQTTLSER